jgi:methionyl-tRNA formyltransferase
MGLRVVYFGNSHSQLSNRIFQALRDTPAELAGVVDAPAAKRGSTNPLSGGVEDFRRQAENLGIPVFEPKSPNEAGFVVAIKSLDPDLLMAAGYTNILRAPILATPRLLAANFHASLLPAYRGMHPVFWCLRNGERWSGMTVHVMDEGIDTGDVLYQVKVRTRKVDSVASLYERIIATSLPLVARLVEEAEAGVLKTVPQVKTGGSYYSRVWETDFALNWGMPAEQLRRWIRVSPGECYFERLGQRIFCLDAETRTIQAGRRAGEIAGIGRRAGIIAAEQGGVRLRHLCMQDGETLTFRQWCDRLDLKVGDQIGPYVGPGG